MRVLIKKKKGVKARKPARKRATKYSDLPDLSNDPYFVKKAESAKKILEQFGTPKK